MRASWPQFSIDDTFALFLEDTGPASESSMITRFESLHFERWTRLEVANEDKQSPLRYQNLENEEDGAQASLQPEGGVSTRDSTQTSIRSTINTSTQNSSNICCVSRAILFVPGFLLLVSGVYHVIFFCCALKGLSGFHFFYLPYCEK
ncbi:PREDICTED: transmembrane protein 134-like [Elephantulus edwardii]|uniref:transmembrane protein 134-like n=1 Tax=Elephantulus edwardii TaxID=28737 RepID=UPI0003F07F84|nr:PREDICTED: transmembrane protein 134-like [Elephantulus edwardii]